MLLSLASPRLYRSTLWLDNLNGHSVGIGNKVNVFNDVNFLLYCLCTCICCDIVWSFCCIVYVHVYVVILCCLFVVLSM